MSPLDGVIIAAYLAGTLLFSAWLARSNTSPDDYYVGGRSMPWWALAVSTLATQSSANSFIGIPAFVALVPGGGLTWLQYELAVPLAILIVMVVFVPVFRGLSLVSIHEYLEIRFDRPTRLLLSRVLLVSRALATGAALCLLVPAVYARQEATRAAIPAGRLDFLVPRFIEMVLPAFVRGLLVAAVLAAAMSSLDSALNSLSAATVRDSVAAAGPARRQLASPRRGW